ncbi:MAG: T9SS type A sorting domain-containing protein [Cytophagaceae bacterium]|jgi:hypothetical protein|nr:T9SS type A sorting domain-containing protein [Cytophagaceae bacterium]
MKKVIFILFAAGLLLSANAQTVLSYKKHGLIPDEKNPMLLAKYMEPGEAGKNVVWDFTKLEMTKPFTGTLDHPKMTKSGGVFAGSNTVLEEFGNYFYFDTDKNGIKHCGYASGSGTTTIRYIKPFMKMKYPFRYGASFSGDYEGVYEVKGEHYGNMVGVYSVSADGLGTLMLPGGVEYEGALRVREVKSYTHKMKSGSYDVVDETFRWYVNEHRFPILVLIKSTYTYASGKASESFRAAYNPVIIQDMIADADDNGSKLLVSAYPNPYVGHVNIKFDVEEESFVNVSVFNSTGKLVSVLENNTLSSGTKEYKFSAKAFGIGTGSYVIKVTVGGETVNEKVMEL